jgi:hypothetical protein
MGPISSVGSSLSLGALGALAPRSSRRTPLGTSELGRAASIAEARLDGRGRGATVTGGSVGAGAGIDAGGGTLVAATGRNGLAGGTVLLDLTTVLTRAGVALPGTLADSGTSSQPVSRSSAADMSVRGRVPQDLSNRPAGEPSSRRGSDTN